MATAPASPPAAPTAPAYRLGRELPPLREAIVHSTRQPEAAAVAALLPRATFPPAARERIRARALALAAHVRQERRRAPGAESLMHAFALSSAEGIALMCLAEALLRIPDTATADALIRDKIGRGDWQSHLGSGDSLFVNAASWGLFITGRIVSPSPDATSLARALSGVLDRVGEPVIRAAMRMAMRLLGDQFVLGETIDAALERARMREALGYTYSYDMLGEAAVGAADARRYADAYAAAIATLGRAAAGRPPAARPGVSIKLSALHPRYVRAQHDRVLAELLPTLVRLATMAKSAGIDLAIDAEEANRLDLSLDLFDALARVDALEGWNGLGFVAQAYQKRAPGVIDWLAALAAATRRRIPVRLVKGAYWDAEVKFAQVEGHADYPVFTRKAHTDVAYLACARTMLARRDVLYPQFATHNAATLAAIIEMAGPARDYEFQCLHGMGEVLYDAVVRDRSIGVPCRIYAPVGTHATLLAYLVRRLLENGANSSFVNQVVDAGVDLDRLVADPADLAAATGGTPHPRIPLPARLYPDRANSPGVDLADEAALRALDGALNAAAAGAQPVGALPGEPRPDFETIVHSPIDGHVVGRVRVAAPADVAQAVTVAAGAGLAWSGVAPADRAAVLDRAADLLEERSAAFLDLAVREAGKTLRNAVGEVREAADFCRYYAAGIRAHPPAPALGPVAAISPWNFPLAIFAGQVAGALAAGNPVLAKPAEQTPLIAAAAVRAFHDAGVPPAALQLLPGPGDSVGAALVSDPRIAGVVFTGSTEVAIAIHRTLARRGNVPLVAETGGQNAMIVDSSALLEQVVADAVTSAFDSAGQRCSALRVLFLQEDIAERALDLLAQAMAELVVGDPRRLATDVGPIIDADARRALVAHVERMEREAKLVARTPLPPDLPTGSYLAPVAFEIPDLGVLDREVFGPVLHVVRWRAGELDRAIDAIDATGYALTLGVHSRIDATIERVAARSRAGNVYANRNQIGAVVGVQPFGGEGLSGTGPKAGGPLFVPRLTRDPGDAPEAPVELIGPTGERNRWRVAPRGRIVALGGGDDAGKALREQALAALAAGNPVLLAPAPSAHAIGQRVARDLRSDRAAIDVLPPGHDWSALPDLAGVLAADPALAADANRRLAARPGVRLPVIEPAGDPPRYPGARLVVERMLTVNTTAAGGNASLVAAMD